MKLILPLLAALAGLLCAPAQAQWHWIDKSGRPVFSDRPPPPDIPDKNIRKQPGMRAAEPLPTATVAPVRTDAAAPKPPSEDQALTAKKQQATGAEAERRRAEEERLARQQADSCARARQTRSGLTAGGRIARTNEKGEREFLDEAGIAAEIQRIDAIIAADCK